MGVNYRSLLTEVYGKAPEGVFVVKHETIIYVNSELERIVGRDLTGSSIYNIFSSLQVESVKTALADKGSFHVVHSLFFSVPCSISAYNSKYGVTVSIMDLSRSQFAMEWSPEAIDMACNEMRNPLNDMVFALTSLAQKCEYPEIALLNRGVHQLLARIENISTIISCNTENTASFLRPRELVSELFELLDSVSSRLEEQGHIFKFEFCKDEIILNCDIRKIKRALLRIIVEAFRILPPNTPLKLNVVESETNIFFSFTVPTDAKKIDLLYEEYQKQRRSLGVAGSAGTSNLFMARAVAGLHNGVIMQNHAVPTEPAFILSATKTKSSKLLNKTDCDDIRVDYDFELTQLSDMLSPDSFYPDDLNTL